MFLCPHFLRLILTAISLLASCVEAKTILSADGNSDGTYSLINKVLGKGKESEETPDCAHPSFGHHITQVEDDDDSGGSVFAFYIHVTPDNDRCQKDVTDRQRNEIKVYGPSPDSLKGFEGDTVSFSWDFKLPSGFQASTAFTHIHQIKAGDGPNDGSPIITLTPRYVKSTGGQRLEVIHTTENGSDDKTTTKLKEVDLSPFLGQWVHVTEKITYGESGAYAVTIKRTKDKKTLLSYQTDGLELWRDGSTFNRPKWGIYRGLSDKGRLRDEKVLFNNFCLSKNDDKDLCK